jgi:hypothetical protein
MGVAKVVCQTPLFSIKTSAILGIQQVVMLHLAATLCKSGETTNVVFRMDIFVPPTSPHIVYEANHTKIPKVQLESQHVVVAKLHDLLVQLTIDRANFISNVMVVHHEEGIF